MAEDYEDRDLPNLLEAFEFARATIQALIAINGGACVAIIAFYGQALAAVKPAARGALSCALTWFVVGVVLATLTLFAGYIAQMLWGGSALAKHKARNERVATRVTGFAVLLAAGSLVCFVVGCCFARGVIAG